MIDLESIGEGRAESLGQEKEYWLDAVKQPVFNEFSEYLSDGEIEHFLNAVQSPEAVNALAGSFVLYFRSGEDSAYSKFLEVVEVSPLNLEQPLDFYSQLSQWAKSQSLKLEFSRKLELYTEFAKEHPHHKVGEDQSSWLASTSF
ncbi:MAG TPA: hypothetical protein DCL41_10445 [Bdellovibrionales bacterium]|nr:hypothetical protein [Bdellovibrionales bacterium]